MSLTIDSKRAAKLVDLEQLEVGQCFESTGEYSVKIDNDTVFCFTTNTVDRMDRRNRVRPVDLYAIER